MHWQALVIATLGVLVITLAAELRSAYEMRRKLRNRALAEAIKCAAAETTATASLELLEEWLALGPLTPDVDLLHRTDRVLFHERERARSWGPGHPEDDPVEQELHGRAEHYGINPAL